MEWHVIYLRMDNTSKLAWYVVLSSLLCPLPILRIKDLKLISTDNGNEVTKKKRSNEIAVHLRYKFLCSSSPSSQNKNVK